MANFRYLQLDVFPAKQGGGNPLGVVLDARGLDDAQMQRIARWTNLVETTFVLAADDSASYRLRIFTPHSEIPFAGHPTVGSAHAVLDSGFAKARDGRLVQQCGAGLLPIRIEGHAESRVISVQAPPAHILREGTEELGALRAAIGLREFGKLPPAFVEGGRRWWVAELADEESVRTLQPNHGAIKALARADGCLGLCVFARCANPDYELVVRAFPAGAGIIEDPASGAANGLIAAYIAQRDPHGELARGYRVSQGREMGHDAALIVRIDADATVWVGGRTNTIIDGQLIWN